MADLLKLISGNATVLAVVLSAVGLLAIVLVTIYSVAFFQGRSISFWPPNIGSRPLSPAKEVPAPVPPPEALSIFPHGEPAIKVGTAIATAGGGSIIADSGSYTGGQATLIKAHLKTGEKVIVKLFWRGLNPSSTAWATFSREVQATEGLNHRNIVRVIDRGLWNGYPFIVSEYLPGGTLHDLIASRDRISGIEILSVAEQIAAGIDYANSHGRIHRDLKPSNVLLESDAYGRVAISDFGIARILGAFETQITAAGPGFEGTPSYVAPEIFSSERITPAVDVYSFGVVLFEMIIGRCPFPEVENIYRLFQMKLNQPVPALKEFRSVPAKLNQRLLDTLAVDPKQRPSTARAVISGIEDLLKAL